MILSTCVEFDYSYAIAYASLCKQDIQAELNIVQTTDWANTIVLMIFPARIAFLPEHFNSVESLAFFLFPHVDIHKAVVAQ